MKKLLLVISFAVTFHISSIAQVDVQVNPILLLFEVVQVSIEFPVSENVGTEFNFITGFGEVVFFGLGKYYMKPKYGHDKFFIGAFGGYSPDNGVGGGFVLGYKFLSLKGIAFEVAYGIGRGSDEIEIFPYAKMSVGYRFGGQKSD